MPPSRKKTRWCSPKSWTGKTTASTATAYSPAPTQHLWDKPLLERWQRIKHGLGDLELFGENLYGIHSIAYRRLESYFYLFAVRQGDRWLGWDEVQFYAALFDLPTVPELPITQPLRDVYCADANEDRQLADWLAANLGMSWLDYVETAGALGGYDPQTGAPCCEGLVIRNRNGFATNNGDLPVQPNEFDNLFKLVRAKHVKTDVHWTKTWQPATLIDYDKYGWHGYEYQNQQ